MQFLCRLWFWGWDTSNGCACVFVNALYTFLLYNCEMSECALICIISFLPFFPSQFSAPFCPEKLNNFLFWQQSHCLVGVKMSFSALSSCCIPQARLPDRSPSDGTGARSGAAGALLLMAVPGRGRWGQRAPSAAPRQSGPRHTQSACVRRHKAASKEPTKQRSRLPRCQVSCPYALRASSETLQHRLGIQPFHCPATSAGGFLPGAVASYTTPGPDAQPRVRWELALLLCDEQGATWMYSRAVCPSVFRREAAEPQEQHGCQSSPKGCSRQLGGANPSRGSRGAALASTSCPPTLTQTWPSWMSHSPSWGTWVVPHRQTCCHIARSVVAPCLTEQVVLVPSCPKAYGLVSSTKVPGAVPKCPAGLRHGWTWGHFGTGLVSWDCAWGEFNGQ